jgi:biotin/methionine sulfoxide reductase
MESIEYRPHSSHWGAFSAAVTPAGLEIRPRPDDPRPSPILQNLVEAPAHRVRITRPAIRRGWLDHGPAADAARGAEPFVEVGWPEALDVLAAELQRVRTSHGSEAIYGGSYGWSSAGRFHHAQSQVHRFLNMAGGYTRSVNTYSAGASAVILPHILADGETVQRNWANWPGIVKSTELVVAFGGMALKNTAVSAGGTSQHVAEGALEAAARRGCKFVLVSPIRDDFAEHISSQWLPIRPATDVALMLGLAHTLVSEQRQDRDFLDRCTVGYDLFERYLLGGTDGVSKTAAWAERVTGVDAASIVDLARRMSSQRTLVTVSFSLQRAQFGEQPVWMGVALAALLGQHGRDGGGFAFALGNTANSGRPPLAVSIPSLPQGDNAVQAFIPVARIADMLLHPGEPFDYDGRRLRYPDIRLVYWAGGNPFHHHQDLNRLRRAFSRPDTVVVHDSVWTATARHADIVLPATLTLEREDLGGAPNDDRLIAMHQVLPPHADALDDYTIFSELSSRLGHASRFTEDRSARQWLEHLYGQLAEGLDGLGLNAPPFDEFWELGELTLPLRSDHDWPLKAFRDEPERHPLATPSGKIEIHSTTIAGFAYPDCPGHPTWLEPDEWLGGDQATRYPLQLVSNQPATRLHSQLDFGRTSLARKIKGREPIRIHPNDAETRGIRSGDIVRVLSPRGACLAGALISESMRPGVVQMATGAWYDPQDPARPETPCLHGNPNAVTRDIGTSRLAQGCSGQLCLVDVERFNGNPPPVRAHEPPAFVLRNNNS